MSYIKGLNRDGFDKDGYDVDGYNRYGYDKDGYNRWGFNRTGYDRGGKQDTHRIYDQNGFDDQCLDIQGEVPVLQFNNCACRTLNEPLSQQNFQSSYAWQQIFGSARKHYTCRNKIDKSKPTPYFFRLQFFHCLLTKFKCKK